MTVLLPITYTPARDSATMERMADEMTSEREFNARNIAEFRSNDGKVGGQFEGFRC